MLHRIADAPPHLEPKGNHERVTERRAALLLLLLLLLPLLLLLLYRHHRLRLLSYLFPRSLFSSPARTVRRLERHRESAISEILADKYARIVQ